MTQVARKWFAVGCAVELALLVVAAGIAWAVDVRLLGGLHWSVAATVWGLVATAPLLLLFWCGLRTSYPPAASIRRTLESAVAPVLGQWSIAQLVAISVLAGVCEEILFRAVIQGALAGMVGTLAALVVASALFGLAHLITLAYGVTAALIGLYLGGLWILTGNLLAPVVTHAAYDAAALVYFLRIYRARPGNTPRLS